jgi:hypothetical protein
VQGLNRAKKLLLASAGTAALAVPLLIGFGHAPAVRAQSQADGKPIAFDVASIKPAGAAAGNARSEPGLRFLPGRVESLPAGVIAKQLITEAYQITEHQVLEGHVGSDRIDSNWKRRRMFTPTESKSV